jgi:plasmid stability protein
MKNIAVSLDDELYRRARIRAAQEETSVSAVVRRFLTEFASEGTEFERLKRREQELREQIQKFRAAERLPRESAHERQVTPRKA